jgi:NADH-quinone oxidoreductase subunit G
LTNETLYGFQKLMRCVFQSNHIDSVCRWNPLSIEQASPFAPLTGLLGAYSRKALTDLLDSTDALVVIGSNVTDENPVSDYLIRQAHSRQGFDLFMLSSRPSRLDKLARAYARYLPGEEPMLMASLLRQLAFRSGGAHTDFAAVPEPPLALATLDPAAVAIRQQWQAQLVEALQGAGSVTLLLGSDLLRSPLVATTLQTLHELLEWRRSRNRTVNLQFLFDHCNQLGAWDFGLLPNTLPGYRTIADPDNRRLFEAAWRSPLPVDAGCDFNGMLALAEKGQLDLLYVVGADPLLACPDRERVRSALAGVKLLIVQDAFLTETARQADVVLPGLTFAETDGTFSNNEGRVQRLRAFQPLPGEAKPDLTAFSRVAAALGADLGPDSPHSLFAEMAQLVPAYAELTYEGLGLDGRLTHGGKDEPAPEPMAPLREPSDRRAPLAMQASAAGTDTEAGLEPRDRFYLITGNSLFHSGYLSERSNILKSVLKGPYVEISAADGQELGVTEGERVRVRGKGHAVMLRIKINPGLPRRVVFVPDNFREVGLNRWLTAGQYPYPVTVEKWLIPAVQTS